MRRATYRRGLRLSEAEVERRLRPLMNWRRTGKRIYRVVKLEGFTDGVRLLRRIAEIADEMNHHPDVSLGYGRMRISLTTHDEGGLTDRDFKLARRIERLLRSRGL